MVHGNSKPSRAGESILIFGAVILLLLFAKVLLVPLAFALALSFLLAPAVHRLEKRGVRRSFAVSLVSGLAFSCLLGAAYLLWQQAIHVVQTLPAYSAIIEQKIGALHSPSEGYFKATLAMLDHVSGQLAAASSTDPAEALTVRIVASKSEQLRTTLKMAGAVLEPLGQTVIVLVFTLYMLINREELRHRLLLLVGMDKLNPMTRALGDAATRISEYLILQLEVNAAFGLLFGVGLYGLGVPYAALWGPLAGLLRIVPFVGTLAAALPALVLAVADPRGWWPAAAVAALFLLLELVTGNFIEPLLFSSRTGISELALLASAIFWSMLWGFPGLILSTPLTVCLVVMGRHVPEFVILHNLLGANAKLSPAAHLYERLLTMDQIEAWAIAERFLKGKPLVTLYDQVLLPVLSLAEEDRYKGALTEVQARFLLLSLGELVARLSVYAPVPFADGERSTRSVQLAANRVHLQKDFAVLCIAGEEKANALANVMLAQVLESAGHRPVVLSADAVSDEVLDALAQEKDTVIILSALPPFAFAQTRALCQRVRAHLPENRIAVGLWNSSEDAEELLARFGAASPEVVVGTLAKASEHVEAWQRATKVVR